MRHSITIGDQEFSSKKDALGYFKNILHRYNIGDNVDKNDFNDLLALLESHPRVVQKIGVGIELIRIAKLKFNTRGFELIRIDNSTEFFSYTKRINAPKSDFSRFNEACRQAIQNDLRNVKLAFFDKYSKKGKVKCQESGELSKFEELSIDHRQPNTFSVIVDRFVELHNIDLKEVDYIDVDGGPNKIADVKLKERFRNYHKSKANLRVVKLSLNIGRASQAKIKRQKKDLRIN